MISAVVCDDQRLFGESFGAALRAAGARVSVTVEPEETVANLENAAVDRVVMSVLFPQRRGLQAMRHIRGRWPRTCVCGVCGDEELAQAAVDAGAQVVVTKRAPLGELVETVLVGSWRAPGRSMSPPRTRGFPKLHCGVGKGADYALPARFLTNRERQVLRLLVSARSTGHIADELGISVTTARGYVQSILGKFGVHSRVEAVAYAVRHAVVGG